MDSFGAVSHGPPHAKDRAGGTDFPNVCILVEGPKRKGKRKVRP